MRIGSGIFACLLLSASAWGADQFQVVFDSDLEGVEVSACFDGEVPSTLYRSTAAQKHTVWIRSKGQEIRTRSSEERLRLPSLPNNSCVEWRVDLAKAVDAQEHRLAFRSGPALVVSTDLWFWKGPWRRPLEVNVEVPGGMSFSTPWQQVGSPETHSYRPTLTPSAWPSRTAVGHFPIHRKTLDDAIISIALAGDLQELQQEKLLDWTMQSLMAVNSVFGHFPRPALQVLVVPIGAQSGPVPWAHVMRGGGPAAELFVDQNRSSAAFQKDWTATHEFSHILIPYVSMKDRWLSEGLASYYQNVLMARDGRITEQQAWQKLYEGFQRGERGTRSDTLAEATRSGRDATMRVYWSGAAMMLMADMRLRDATDGEQNLDTALNALNQCCLEPGKRWRANELMAKLDELTGTDIFTGIYSEHVYARSFPDMSDTYAELGLKPRYGKIRLEEDAPLESVRRQIMLMP